LRKGILIIKDPDVAKLLADDTRRRMLHLLRHREMSAADLAKALDKNYSSVMHHLNLLREAGLVEETRVEKVRNMVQSYYKATARKFIISYSLSEALASDVDYVTWREDTLQRMVEGLETFAIKIPESQRARVTELMDTCSEREKMAIEEVVEQQTDPGKLDRYVEGALIQLMANLKLSNDEEYSSAIRELSKLINL